MFTKELWGLDSYEEVGTGVVRANRRGKHDRKQKNVSEAVERLHASQRRKFPKFLKKMRTPRKSRRGKRSLNPPNFARRCQTSLGFLRVVSSPAL
jgi:hypothetical protein